MKKNIALCAAVVVLVGPAIMIAQARPQYARKEKKPCGYCHLNPKGGGARGFRGIFYQANGLSLKKFNETVQAKKAGVKPKAMGQATKPTKPYKGK